MSLTVNGTTLTGTSCVCFNNTPVNTIWACDTSNATCCKVWSKYGETVQFLLRAGNNTSAMTESIDEINSTYNNYCNVTTGDAGAILGSRGESYSLCLSSFAVVCATEDITGSRCFTVCATNSSFIGYSYDVYVKQTGCNFRIYNRAGSNACTWSPSCCVRGYDTVAFCRDTCVGSFTIDNSAFCFTCSFQYTTYDTNISNCFQDLSCITFDNARQQLLFDVDTEVYLLRCDGVCIPQYKLSSVMAGYIDSCCIGLSNTILNTSNGDIIDITGGCWACNFNCMYECPTYGCI